MSKPVHGGGVDLAMQALGLPREQIADFSASINPLGTPAAVIAALQSAIERIGDYPEIDAASLRQALADFHQLPAENLLPGSGSTELIYLLPRVLRPRKALLVTPCFGEYAPALQRVATEIETLPLSPADGFSFSIERVLAAVTAETDLVVLANPGNPTGVATDPQQLLALADRLGDCRLLIDEAFADFCPELSLLSAVPQRDNLFILRSLTKFYAIPGLRAGYLAGSAEQVAELAACREPWALSNLAIAAAKSCLSAQAFQAQTLREIPLLRKGLQQGLEQLGVRVFPAVANYLLCQLPATGVDATGLVDALRSAGILIRNCADFSPLDERFFRVAVLGATENARLLAELQKALA